MTYFTKEHEWLTVEGDVATVGITRHAAEALGDVVFVEVGDEGTLLEAGAAAAVVESVKAASEIYAPVRGSIVAANPQVAEDPGLIGSDPEGEGWIYRLRIEDPDDLAVLLDRRAYDAFAASL